METLFRIIDVMQILGGAIIGFGYIPQIIKILKTKSVEDLSLSMWGQVFLGLGLMEVYAVKLAVVDGVFLFMITNSIGFILSGVLVFLIKYYEKK